MQTPDSVTSAIRLKPSSPSLRKVESLLLQFNNLKRCIFECCTHRLSSLSFSISRRVQVYLCRLTGCQGDEFAVSLPLP